MNNNQTALSHNLDTSMKERYFIGIKRFVCKLLYSHLFRLNFFIWLKFNKKPYEHLRLGRYRSVATRHKLGVEFFSVAGELSFFILTGQVNKNIKNVTDLLSHLTLIAERCGQGKTGLAGLMSVFPTMWQGDGVSCLVSLAWCFSVAAHWQHGFDQWPGDNIH